MAEDLGRSLHGLCERRGIAIDRSRRAGGWFRQRREPWLSKLTGPRRARNAAAGNGHAKIVAYTAANRAGDVRKRLPAVGVVLLLRRHTVGCSVSRSSCRCTLLRLSSAMEKVSSRLALVAG